MVETTDAEWKLNNNWTPYYARKLMANEPELKGFFEIRPLKHEKTLEWEEP
jgi:hypothetical protein